MDKTNLAYSQIPELEMPGRNISTIGQADINGQAVTYLAESQQSNSDQSSSTTPNQSKCLKIEAS